MTDGWQQVIADVVFSRGFAVIAAAVLLAGFLRGFIGFGAALVSMPVISLVLGPTTAVAIVTIMGLPSTLQLLPDAIRHGEPPIVVPMMLGVFAATPIGTMVLVSVDPGLMKIVISTIVVAMVAFLSAGWRLQSRVRASILLLAGIIGGLVQGTAGMGGPPVVAVALAREGTPEQQRGNVLAVMTAISFSSVPPLLYFGLFTTQAMVCGIVLFPLYAGATWFGSRYFARNGKSHYRKAALAMLAIIGLTTLALAILQAQT
ncbi:MAG: sulfite exporter TauE/SafE family protein [Hyphomicrobiaceae bacterium]